MPAPFRVSLCVRLFAAVLVLTTPAYAATLYVSTTGSDANPGTLQAPVATPARALALSTPGDTILLRGGTYTIGTTLQLRHAGLTFASYPGERARLVADTSDASGAPTIVVIYASQITVQGLELQGGSLYGVKVDDYFGPQTGIIIRGLYIHHTGRDGIKVQRTDGILIESSEVAFTGVRDPTNAEGIDIMGAYGATVRGNYVHDTATNGIYVKGGTRQAVIEGNRVERTGYSGILLGTDTGAQFMRDGAVYEASDSVARNNIIVDARMTGLGAVAGDNLRFEHNTVINAARGGQAVFRATPNTYNTPTRNIVLKNNIFVLSSTSTRPMVHLYNYSGSITSDSNLYFHAGGQYQFWRESSSGSNSYWNLAGWRTGMNADWQSRAADPLLDAAALFLPLAGSPAIDTGEALFDVTTDYAGIARPQGPGHDIGAREKVVATAPPPANVAPTVSITSPTTNASFTAPATIAISASAADADGTVTRVDFYSGGTLLASDTTSPYAYTWSNVPAGSFTLTARAVDNSGYMTISAGVSVRVTTVSLPPPSLPSPWQTQDIGAVGVAGTASASNGTFTVEGAGLDIWGTADAFRYVWQPITGDVNVVARVASIEYVHAWVKGGVMIRERLTADSPHALMAVTPGKGHAFQRRTAAGGISTHTSGGAGTAPAWVKLERRGTRISAFVSANGTTWTLVGTETFAMGGSAYVGLAVTSHSTSQLATTRFDNVTVTAATPPAPSLPSPWQAQDIGAVGVAGKASASSGTFTVEGGGADIWGSADAFRYVWQPITGDVDVVARVASLEYVHAWSKGGVMIRERLTADSAHAMMAVTPGKGHAFQRRTAAGGISTHTSGGAGTAPAWVKLERRGTTITAYVSSTGTTWVRVGSDTFSMAASVYVGLAVSSHNVSQLATATFASVTVTPAGALPAPWKSQDVGAVASAGTAAASNGTFTIEGSGLDVWGTADAMQYVWQPLSGDGEIVARVTSVENVHAWTKAGVMIRERLTADSTHASMLVTPGKGLAFQRRVSQGGISVHTTGGAGTAPAWVKLERRGNVISGYRSADGVSWTFVGNDAFTMGTTVYVGLAVSAHDATRLATATFAGVAVR